MKNANLQSWFLAAVLALGVPGAAGCARENGGAPKAAVPAPKSVADFFPVKVGDKTVRMQLAVRPAEMERGLMGRRDLGPDDGMIFVYEKPQALSFWMRNTPTALDIGFFDPAGVLQEIYPLYPFDERAVGSRGDRLSFALEVHQGWYAANGIKPGAKLDLPALAEALRARGFDPKRFGL